MIMVGNYVFAIEQAVAAKVTMGLLGFGLMLIGYTLLKLKYTRS